MLNTFTTQHVGEICYTNLAQNYLLALPGGNCDGCRLMLNFKFEKFPGLGRRQAHQFSSHTRGFGPTSAAAPEISNLSPTVSSCFRCRMIRANGDQLCGALIHISFHPLSPMEREGNLIFSSVLGVLFSVLKC